MIQINGEIKRVVFSRDKEGGIVAQINVVTVVNSENLGDLQDLLARQDEVAKVQFFFPQLDLPLEKAEGE